MPTAELSPGTEVAILSAAAALYAGGLRTGVVARAGLTVRDFLDGAAGAPLASPQDLLAAARAELAGLAPERMNHAVVVVRFPPCGLFPAGVLFPVFPHLVEPIPSGRN